MTKSNIIEFPATNTAVPSEKMDCGAGFCTKYVIYIYTGDKKKYNENERITAGTFDNLKEAYIETQECIPDKNFSPDVSKIPSTKMLAGLDLVEVLYENGTPFRTRTVMTWYNEDEGYTC